MVASPRRARPLHTASFDLSPARLTTDASPCAVFATARALASGSLTSVLSSSGLSAAPRLARSQSRSRRSCFTSLPSLFQHAATSDAPIAVACCSCAHSTSLPVLSSPIRGTPLSVRHAPRRSHHGHVALAGRRA
eukprot:2630632-Prymnesium_polylepis.1